MSTMRITLVLLLAAAASYVVTRIDPESVLEAAAAMASLAERASISTLAEIWIILAAILGIAAWDFLKPRPRPKSERRVGGSADAAQAKGRG